MSKHDQHMCCGTTCDNAAVAAYIAKLEEIFYMTKGLGFYDERHDSGVSHRELCELARSFSDERQANK